MNRPDIHPWIPLRVRPERYGRDSLKACRIEATEVEFEEWRGVRYLRIEENGEERWLSKRTRLLSHMERDGVKACCWKMKAWGKFVNLGKNGRRGSHAVPVMFAQKVLPNQITLEKRTLEIQYCPFCGKKLEFHYTG